MTTPPLHSVDFYLGAYGDPAETYRALRQHDPVHWYELADGTGMFFLSRWEDVRGVSRRPERFTTSQACW